MAKSDLFLGLDVGGTHTDAVLIDDKGIVAHYKAVTDHDNLLLSVRTAIEKISGEAERKNIRRINLSTTLSTNAIVENKLEDVCVIISSGPGIDPEQFRIGKHYYAVERVHRPPRQGGQGHRRRRGFAHRRRGGLEKGPDLRRGDEVLDPQPGPGKRDRGRG